MWKIWSPPRPLRERLIESGDELLKRFMKEFPGVSDRVLANLSRDVIHEAIQALDLGVPKELVLKYHLKPWNEKSGTDINRFMQIKGNYARKRLFHEKGLDKVVKRMKPFKVEFLDEATKRIKLMNIYVITEPSHPVPVSRWINAVRDPFGHYPRLGFRAFDACPNGKQVFEELKEEIRKAVDSDPKALPSLAERLIKLEKLKQEDFIFFRICDLTVGEPIVKEHYSYIDRPCGFCGQRHRTWIVLREVS